MFICCKQLVVIVFREGLILFSRWRLLWLTDFLASTIHPRRNPCTTIDTVKCMHSVVYNSVLFSVGKEITEMNQWCNHLNPRKNPKEGKSIHWELMQWIMRGKCFHNFWVVRGRGETWLAQRHARFVHSAKLGNEALHFQSLVYRILDAKLMCWRKNMQEKDRCRWTLRQRD